MSLLEKLDQVHYSLWWQPCVERLAYFPTINLRARSKLITQAANS